MKVISGSQTGADQAGLYAAKEVNLPTGGYVLKRNKTETGDRPDLIKEFGLTELNSSSYPTRTLANVNYADVTLIFYYSPLERGSALTKKYCEQRLKSYLLVNLDNYCDNTVGFIAQEVYEFLMLHKPKVINIAGNRESVAPGIFEAIKRILILALKQYEENIIDSHRSMANS